MHRLEIEQFLDSVSADFLDGPSTPSPFFYYWGKPSYRHAFGMW
jgi:hypothetical protein